MGRIAKVERKTMETEITIAIDLDGVGRTEIDTGLGFFDHMLTLFGVHGGFDLKITAKGDLYVDGHHTVEDVGIVLGRAIEKALGDKIGIKRYGCCYMPMDEALSRVVLDLSSRPYLVMRTEFSSEKIGEMDSELFEEFFKALAFNAGITLHMETLYGKNSHHIAESLFKGFAHALKDACRIDQNIKGVLSSKGTLV
ncbi:MAG TPA: imidazoleglycerol-phosphate dehydratase HisB [Clostridiales bacterium]|nr:imidazoleglycerol-phosphate dehydratase HisB [Clostridiales bacterium]